MPVRTITHAAQRAVWTVCNAIEMESAVMRCIEKPFRSSKERVIPAGTDRLPGPVSGLRVDQQSAGAYEVHRRHPPQFRLPGSVSDATNTRMPQSAVHTPTRPAMIS